MILPKIPSQLIRIALEDMKATIAQGIHINMSSWGSGNLSKNEECSVCFAGSVMLQRTKVGKEPYSFDLDDKNRDQYLFLDEIRKGRLSEAMEELDSQLGTSTEDPIVILQWVEEIPNWIEYSLETQEEFFTQIEQLANMLESKGY